MKLSLPAFSLRQSYPRQLFFDVRSNLPRYYASKTVKTHFLGSDCSCSSPTGFPGLTNADVRTSSYCSSYAEQSRITRRKYDQSLTRTIWCRVILGSAYVILTLIYLQPATTVQSLHLHTSQNHTPFHKQS